MKLKLNYMIWLLKIENFDDLKPENTINCGS